MINIIPASDFIIKMVPFFNLRVGKEISVKPEQPELPLQKSCSEHLGYFSTDVFTWLVLFFFSSLFPNSNFYCLHFIKKRFWRVY